LGTSPAEYAAAIIDRQCGGFMKARRITVAASPHTSSHRCRRSAHACVSSRQGGDMIHVMRLALLCRRWRALIPAGFAAVTAVCSTAPTELPPESLRILFIGNSLTAANNLPEMVRALAAAGHHPTPIVSSVVRPNYSLEDHWNEGAAQQAIRGGHWQLVVLQQGPSALPESRVLLIQYAERFDTVIRAAGGTTGLYMVWPDSTRLTAFDSVAASYRAAAESVAGVLIPAGDAWQAVWRSDSSVRLYDLDGFHPSVAGTYLVACTFFTKLYRQSPRGLPGHLVLAGGASVDVDSALAVMLQQAAQEVAGSR
jgi:hypothetical protein